MKKIKSVTKVVDDVEKIVCDVCKKEFDVQSDWDETSEMLFMVMLRKKTQVL